MDAMDILGELLGHKSQKPSRGGNVLKDIFGRGPQKQSSSPAPPKKPHEIQQQGEELEDLLNVANDRTTHRQSSTPTSKSSNPRWHENEKSPAMNERALLMVRAMINAAKADGSFDQSEQKKLMEKLDSPDRKTMDFVRKELSAPLDLPEFIRSVPVGMEQQVYTMSLIAIDLDTGTEADYLLQLSKGLRIPDDVREKIHERVGAPSVY